MSWFNLGTADSKSAVIWYLRHSLLSHTAWLINIMDSCMTEDLTDIASDHIIGDPSHQ
jgi:hypothetical protein